MEGVHPAYPQQVLTLVYQERARNDAVEGIQGNRNPFIDHPEFVCGAL